MGSVCHPFIDQKSSMHSRSEFDVVLRPRNMVVETKCRETIRVLKCKKDGGRDVWPTTAANPQAILFRGRYLQFPLALSRKAKSNRKKVVFYSKSNSSLLVFHDHHLLIDYFAGSFGLSALISSGVFRPAYRLAQLVRCHHNYVDL